MATVSLRDEVVELLQGLIRLDTVNPPGNETIAALFLREYLERNGVQCELYARDPDRANLVARIRGRGGGPRLALLSHTDTVFADPAEWQVDPWSGEVRDGEIWGRGALDMKGQVAASAVVVASLAREGFEPGGDLIFVAAADEEVGAGYGLPWLCEHHPDAVRCEYAINEGQGDRLEIDGDVYYLCASAEKMSAPFRVVVRGRSGHASKPGIADNALVKAARIVQQLADYRAEQELIPEVRGLLAAVTGRAPETAADAVAAAAATKPPLTEIVDPLLAMTLTPTMIEASKKRNVIPATCEIVVDSRLLPGRTPADARTVVERVLGAGDYELEWIEAQGGTRSPTDTPLWHAVAEFVEAEEPGARIAPVCVAGFTDSHWLRDAFGTVAYGFFPLRTMSPAVADLLVHSADERASVDDLELGVRFLRHVAERIGAGTL